MTVRTSDAIWEGDLKSGQGTMKLGSGAYEGRYSFASRFEQAPGTNPEELLAAAHAGCFSMALSLGLTQAGHAPRRVHTTARVHVEKSDGGFQIPRIELTTDADVPGLDEAKFRKLADEAKRNCPVSKLFKGADISLTAKLSKA